MQNLKATHKNKLPLWFWWYESLLNQSAVPQRVSANKYTGSKTQLWNIKVQDSGAVVYVLLFSSLLSRVLLVLHSYRASLTASNSFENVQYPCNNLDLYQGQTGNAVPIFSYPKRSNMNQQWNLIPLGHKSTANDIVNDHLAQLTINVELWGHWNWKWQIVVLGLTWNAARGGAGLRASIDPFLGNFTHLKIKSKQLQACHYLVLAHSQNPICLLIKLFTSLPPSPVAASTLIPTRCAFDQLAKLKCVDWNFGRDHRSPLLFR